MEYLIGLWYDEIEIYNPESDPIQDGTEHLTQVRCPLLINFYTLI